MAKLEAVQIAGRMFIKETADDGTITETEVLPATTVEKRLAELESTSKAPESKEEETANAATESEAKKETVGDKLKKPVLIGLGIAGAVLFGKKYCRKNETTSATETTSTDVETTTVESTTSDEVP